MAGFANVGEMSVIGSLSSEPLKTVVSELGHIPKAAHVLFLACATRTQPNASHHDPSLVDIGCFDSPVPHPSPKASYLQLCLLQS